jgi:hypothetical protein
LAKNVSTSSTLTSTLAAVTPITVLHTLANLGLACLELLPLLGRQHGAYLVTQLLLRSAHLISNRLHVFAALGNAHLLA